jgi:tetratricopeptide (TPR) repeat protein
VSAPSPSGSPAGATSPTVAEIARLEGLVTADPTDADAQRDLGFALLQRVRETADPSLYAPAAQAFETARGLAPDDALVLAGIGGLQLGKHLFGEALETGHAAVAMSPNLAAARAVVVDALVELGRYDDADAAAGEMLAIRADLSTLARVSYVAELHGKLDVALSAMRQAAATPGLAPENGAFVEALLGNLLVYTGDPSAAADAYDRALAQVPAHAPSLAGEGRLAVGAGDLDAAIALFQRAADILPLPEYVIALADAQAAAGRADEAARNVKLARAEIQLFQASGVVVDVELALFEADHGDPAASLDLATAGYAATPTVRAADALAWALHRLGRDKEAKTRSDEALRLGSRDPLLRYHAGAISAALGDVKAARRDLGIALATDPGFSATGAAEARRILDSLPD